MIPNRADCEVFDGRKQSTFIVQCKDALECQDACDAAITVDQCDYSTLVQCDHDAEELVTSELSRSYKYNGLAPCASDSQRLSGTAVAAKTTLSLDDANIRLIANQKEKLRNCKNKISDNPTASEYTTQALRLLVVAEKLFTTMSQVQVQVLHQYEDNNTCQAVQHLQEMAQGQLRQEGLSKGKVHRERTAFCSCEDGGADI